MLPRQFHYFTPGDQIKGHDSPQLRAGATGRLVAGGPTLGDAPGGRRAATVALPAQNAAIY